MKITQQGYHTMTAQPLSKAYVAAITRMHTAGVSGESKCFPDQCCRFGRTAKARGMALHLEIASTRSIRRAMRAKIFWARKQRSLLLKNLRANPLPL